MVSLAGGLLGIGIGILGTRILANQMDYTFVVPWQTIVFGIFLPVLIGLLAGIIPANRAARQDPVEALKN